MLKNRILGLLQTLCAFALGTVLLGVDDCSQQAKINMKHAGDAISWPATQIYEAVSGDSQSSISNKYSEFKTSAKNAQKKAEEFELLKAQCKALPEENKLNILDVAAFTREMYCDCFPWSGKDIRCEKNLPCCNSQRCAPAIRCPLVCPNDLRLLGKNKKRLNETYSKVDPHAFAFYNSSFDVFTNKVRPADRESLKRELPPTAYNLGMISAKRKFNELAIFNPSKKRLNADDYKSQIKAILKGKPAVIDGYADLNSFSREPAIQKYLVTKIADEWLDKAIRNFSEKKADPKNKMNLDKTTKVLNETISSVNDLGSCTLTFGLGDKGEKKLPVQALEAYKVIKTNSEHLICVYDPNLPAKVPYQKRTSDSTCYPFVKVTADGKMLYKMNSRSIKAERVGEEIQDTTGLVQMHDVSVFAASDQKDAVWEVESLKKKCNKDLKCEDID